MSAQPAKSRAEKPWIALFDLDGTLTWHDTLLPFLLGFVRQRPHRALGCWRLPAALFRYWQDRDRGALKSSVIRMLMRSETRPVIDAGRKSSVAQLEAKGNSGRWRWRSSRHIVWPGAI